jgi:putative colanic acid biosynthesis UDP-glucose lipid carrier transferase
MDLVDEFSIQDAHTCVSKARSGGFDLLYIALPLRDEAVIRFLLDALADSSVVVKYAPDLLGFELLHSSWSDINGIPVVHLQDSPIRGMSALLKCLEDVVLSLVILLLISPVLILTALAIKLTSSGPVLFKQTRYGLNGKPIKVWKFRSMTVCEDGAISQATKNDVRVTRVGAFIRRTSIDEMPQFFNVLGGSMSIVGPRPHAVVHNEEFRKIAPSYMRRHLVKPGITGWAQVNGWRGETDSEEKILKRTEFDLYYIQHWSIWFDIKIVFLTILKGFFNQNAY